MYEDQETKYWGFGFFDRFKEDWLVTRQAVRLFLVAALLVLAVTPVLLGKVDPASHLPPWANTIWIIIEAVIVFAMIFLWCGMVQYWRRVDSCS